MLHDAGLIKLWLFLLMFSLPRLAGNFGSWYLKNSLGSEAAFSSIRKHSRLQTCPWSLDLDPDWNTARHGPRSSVIFIP